MSEKGDEKYQNSGQSSAQLDQEYDEVLREYIRQKVDEKIKSLGDEELTEKKREKLRDEVKRDIFEKGVIDPKEFQKSPGTFIKEKYKSMKSTFKKLSESFGLGHSGQYNDSQSIFDDETQLALAISRNYDQDHPKDTLPEFDVSKQDEFGQSYMDELEAEAAQLEVALRISKLQAERRERDITKLKSNSFENIPQNSSKTTIHSLAETQIEQEHHLENDASKSECGICFESTDNPISYGCEHKFCSECITTGLTTAIKEGLIESLKCPEPNCDVNASQQLVKTLVSNEMYERYETLLLKAAVADMDNIVYCSNTGCGAIIEAEEDIGVAICYRCGLTFCTNCSKPYHGTSDCELTDNERHDMLQLYQDELIAERLLEEESQTLLAIEAAEREDEEWLRMIKEEQNSIRLQEQLEKEELERQEAENRRLEAERVRLEEERREKERIEYERTVQQNRERERDETVRRQNRRKEDNDSENIVRQTSRPCPGCRSPIEKNGGCLHITCSKCGLGFCYGCMAPMPHHSITGHSCPSGQPLFS